ncbi:MAG: cytochrome-c peroxidase [Sandaracinaceae bacterium]|nr:cytochrome-c peroxidase [Sandaracinaceae bacterium]
MSRQHLLLSLCLGLASAGALVACGEDQAPTPTTETPSTETPPTTETPPSTTATPATPAAAPAVEPLPTPEVAMSKVLLGRRLFHDTRLSGDGTLSCASCHSLDTGGAEHRATSQGINGQIGPINAPTVLNSGLNFVQFWDGRAADLQAQAAGPVANPGEMGASWETVVATLGASEADRTEFSAIYPDGVTQANITDAIAEYERSLATPSRFDAFLRGDQSALSADEQRGWATFQEVGCTACHRGPNVGGGMYQRMGLVRNYFELRGTPLTDADNGRFNVTHDENDRHRFKVPTLRNIELTAPYFHDGSQTELAGAVRIMGQVQLNRDLTDAQVTDIVAFLRSLTGTLPEHARMPGAAPAEPAAPTEAAPTPTEAAPAPAPTPPQ